MGDGKSTQICDRTWLSTCCGLSTLLFLLLGLAYRDLRRYSEYDVVEQVPEAVSDGAAHNALAQHCQVWCGLPGNSLKPLHCGVLWFLHIGKTGGESVSHYLRENADWTSWEFVRLYFPNLGQRWNESDEWVTIQERLQRPCPRLIVEQHHGVPGMGEYMMDNEILPIRCALKRRKVRLLLATLLREGSARATSHAFYDHIPHDRYVKFINKTSPVQVKYLLWGKTTQRGDARTWADVVLDEQALARAREVLRHFDIVGRTEQHEQFVDQLNLALGWAKSTKAKLENPTAAQWKYELTERELHVTHRCNRTCWRDSFLVDEPDGVSAILMLILLLTFPEDLTGVWCLFRAILSRWGCPSSRTCPPSAG